MENQKNSVKKETQVHPNLSTPGDCIQEFWFKWQETGG